MSGVRPAYGGLLRGKRNGIAGRVGYGFRRVFGQEKGVIKTETEGVRAEKHGVCE